MEITRISTLTGIKRTLDLNVTEQQLLDYEKGMKMQYAFPNLNLDEREFFLTGITCEEWDNFFNGMASQS